MDQIALGEGISLNKNEQSSWWVQGVLTNTPSVSPWHNKKYNSFKCKIVLI